MNTSFLTSCCRVCLGLEPIMIYVYDKVDEFNLTLAQLLDICGNLMIDDSDEYSKLICKDCTEELLMVAKFREKCKSSEETLLQINDSLKKQQSEEPETATSVNNDDGSSSCKVPDEVLEDELVGNIFMNDAEDTNSVMDMFEFAFGNNEANRPKDNEPSTIEEMLMVDDIDVEEHEDENQEADGDNNTDLNQFETLAEVAESPANIEEHFFVVEDDTNISEEVLKEEAISFDEDDPIAEEADPIEESESRQEEEGSTEEEADPSEHSNIDNVIEKLPVFHEVQINFNCDSCGAGFTQMNNLKKHLLTHQDSSQLFECRFCTMLFTSSVECNKHVKTHAALDTISDTAVVNSSNRITGRKSLKSQSNRKSIRRDHNCQYCGMGFPSQSLLVTHVRTHTGDRPFQCSFCDKTFSTRGGLNLHTRRHTGVKPYECEVCQKRFVESSNLRVHMRIHTGEKPHQCNQCSRTFSRVFLLQIHQRTHTGERPYVCSICNKAFAQQGDLAAHTRIHTGERPHQCEVCGKGFIKSSALTGHMRQHHKKQECLDDEELGSMEYDDIYIEYDEEEIYGE